MSRIHVKLPHGKLVGQWRTTTGDGEVGIYIASSLKIAMGGISELIDTTNLAPQGTPLYPAVSAHANGQLWNTPQ